MDKKKLSGLPRLAAASRNSLAGFRDAWRGEEAFRIEFTLLILSIPAAIWVARDPLHMALLIASVLLVLIVEVLNTAIEAAIDRIGPERHELSRMAKDMGSLAVVLAALVPGLLWLTALYEKFFA
ncbi:hypothetical protein A3731_24715 [Roseovarius sp. HI0049]|nr:hypothetical protein A3731_24715 [Roseovarius sp. HI0049]